MDFQILQDLALNVGGPFGGALLAVKYALNSMNGKIDNHSKRLDSHSSKIARNDSRLDLHGNRLTRVETRMDLST